MDDREKISLAGRVSYQEVNIQSTICIQAEVSNSISKATKTRRRRFCAGMMGAPAVQQVRVVFGIQT
jgi:hypothetical protein